MKNKPTQMQSGFTLIETVVAIFILSLTIGALLTLAAGGIFSVRYARNQIVADNLLQETMEYLHNSRDTMAQSGSTWTDFIKTLNVDTTGTQFAETDATHGCFSAVGCIVDPFNNTASKRIVQCQNSGCSATPILYYPDNGFYGYGSFYPFGSNAASVQTSYVRTVTARFETADQLVVTAQITWLNGLNPKTVTHTMILTNWHV